MHRIDFRVSGFGARICEEMCLHLCPSYVTSRPILFLLFNEAMSLVVSDINKVADWLRTKFSPVGAMLLVNSCATLLQKRSRFETE